jgi:hypothetical protein
MAAETGDGIKLGDSGSALAWETGEWNSDEVLRAGEINGE